MKKKMLMPVISSLLALCISGVFTIKIGHAACGCTCVMVCDSACEWECTGCGLVEGAEVARRCCVQAYQQSGDTEPCIQEGGSY